MFTKAELRTILNLVNIQLQTTTPTPQENRELISIRNRIAEELQRRNNPSMIANPNLIEIPEV